MSPHSRRPPQSRSRSIILASTSPRRKEILTNLGLRFTAVASNYEEDMTLKLKPKALAKHLSLGKARAVAAKQRNAIIIAADTFVVYNQKVLGKPRHIVEARRMLRALSGTTHSVMTGVALIDTVTGQEISWAAETKIFFRTISAVEIDRYIASKEPLDKAGAYGIQGLGAVFVKKISGDYFNVLGLPVFSLAAVLQKFGISIF